MVHYEYWHLYCSVKTIEYHITEFSDHRQFLLKKLNRRKCKIFPN